MQSGEKKAEETPEGPQSIRAENVLGVEDEGRGVELFGAELFPTSKTCVTPLLTAKMKFPVAENSECSGIGKDLMVTSEGSKRTTAAPDSDTPTHVSLDVTKDRY